MFNGETHHISFCQKRAATEVVLAGIPLVVIEAMGYRAQLDTLEIYIGETIRQQVVLLPILVEAPSVLF